MSNSDDDDNPVLERDEIRMLAALVDRSYILGHCPTPVSNQLPFAFLARGVGGKAVAHCTVQTLSSLEAKGLIHAVGQSDGGAFLWYSFTDLGHATLQRLRESGAQTRF